jgi:hypothetical protein
MFMESLASSALGEEGAAGLLCALSEPIWPQYMHAATKHDTAVAVNSMLICLSA